MAAEAEPERPRAVTIIGWVWVVLSVLSLCRVLINLAVWSVLEPAAPRLFGNIVSEMPRFWLVRPLLEHMKLMMTAQAVWWIAVGVSAFGLLRLRPWARVAMQGVAWALLAYVALFGIFWLTVFTTIPTSGAGGTQFSNSAQKTLVLVAGLAGCALIATALVTMIIPLRSAKVRQAFRQTPPSPGLTARR